MPSVCIFYGRVVTDLKGDLGTITKTDCVLTIFAQVPTETCTCWSLKDHGGISKQ